MEVKSVAAGQTNVTEAAIAIRAREDGHKRFARLVVPILGIIMLAAAIAGFHFSSASPVQIIIMSLSALFYLLSYSSLICGQWTIGMIPQAGIGAYFFLLSALLPSLCSLQNPFVKAACLTLFGLTGIIVLLFLALLSVMLLGSLSPAERGEYTLMVLGCKLKNNQPGRMLRRRLAKAAEELRKNQSLVCIVSGGRAPDQQLAEAEAMEQWLLDNGIASERIIAETLSSTTYENFLFSKKLLSERSLPRRVGVVTDRFHQYRSGRIARTAGIDSFPVSCRTAWYLAIQFWMRDALCIIERLIRGHW